MSALNMENAEMSINGHGGMHNYDGHKKHLIHNDVDSGFGENWSMSQSHITASTSALSNTTKLSSSSFKRSIDLETITETNEQKELQETPTTRSARCLSAFHINTPVRSETTPTKANYFSNPYESYSGRSSQKARSQNSIRWNNSPKLKSIQRLKSFSQAPSFESIDENYENEFGNEEINVCNQSIGVSPIKPHNTSNFAVLQEKVPSLQRHPSGIDSSTPKTFRRIRTQAILQPTAGLANGMPDRIILRKTQSFSPLKRRALREPNYQSPVETEMALLETDRQPEHNPIKHVLAFPTKKFEQLIQSQPNFNVPSLPMKQDTVKSSPVRSRLVKEFSRKKTMKPVMAPLPTNASVLDESALFLAMANENEAVSNKQDDSLMDISGSASFTIKTPSTNNQQKKTDVSDTPTGGNKIVICEDAIRTPVKRFEKSTSFNHLSLKSSPEKEKYELVYGHLPCTPPKNHIRRPLKRTAAAHIDSPLANAPSAKRKLYKLCERSLFYNGIDQLDILTQLKNHEMNDIMDRILGYLPDEDLQAVYSVCRSWKGYVDGNRKFRARRRKYIKSMQTVKENVSRRSEIKPVSNNNNNIKPLHVHNLNFDLHEKPILVSPSTQRFRENQKIIRSLKPEQRVLYCPRCNGISVVHPATAEPKGQRRSPRTKARKNSKVVVSEFATCLKESCNFEFCTNCNDYRHVNSKCTKRPLGSSPKSDEDSPYRIEMKPQRPVRRLKRLVF